MKRRELINIKAMSFAKVSNQLHKLTLKIDVKVGAGCWRENTFMHDLFLKLAKNITYEEI